MITYQITSTTYSLNPDGTAGRITSVIWSASKTDETVTGTLQERGTPIAEDYAPADASYENIDEAELITWVVDLEDQLSIEAQLDEEILELASPRKSRGLPWQARFPIWKEGIDVVVGGVYTFRRSAYRAIRNHTTSRKWAPTSSPALWREYVPPAQRPRIWVQPTGEHDEYDAGHQVRYRGNLWTSLVDANMGEPLSSSPDLWQDGGSYS